MTRQGNSPFAVRGVIEGFYGRPWTWPQRLEMVEFIAARGMNTFVYAPKDDPLLRQDWRSPYRGDVLVRLAELIEHCRAHEVAFVYCASPGLSIKYSSDEDLAALTAKFAALADLGVTRFGLLLDDIPMTLQHAADRAAYRDLAEAHIALVDHVHERLMPRAQLIVCPTVYRGYGDEDYVVRLGRGIDPRVDLFWTGRAICSATIDLPDAATFARSTGRPATYWDNYPVNDLAMSNELHIGPYRGRDPHLYRFATGIIANGMELFESSKIAFATIADYLWSPETYDPEERWRIALRDVVGEADLEAFAQFADNVRFSCLAAEDALALNHALEMFAFRIHEGDEQAAGEEFGAFADAMLAAADHLLHGPVVNHTLIREARRWIEVFQIGAESCRRVADLALDGRLRSDGPTELIPYLTRLRSASVRVFGNTLDMALSDLTAAPITLSVQET